MKLLARLFPKAAEVAAANQHAENAEAELSGLKAQHKTLWDSYSSHDTTIKNLRNELDALKAKLREQTDADLLLVSARIAVTILRGQKPAASDMALQQNLLAQQAALASPYNQSPGYAGLLQGLGRGGIFGGH